MVLFRRILAYPVKPFISLGLRNLATIGMVIAQYEQIGFVKRVLMSALQQDSTPIERHNDKL